MATPRSSRLAFRLDANQKRLIDQAAVIRGQSVTEFAISGLVQLARTALDEAQVRRLSARDGDSFLKMLERPPMPNARLKRAAERYKRRSRLD